MKTKNWIFGWLVIVLLGLGLAGWTVYRVDPFFHYHRPDTSRYYYVLDNQRSQNYGISRQFDYDGIITGTSMTNNFKVSEADALFGGNFIKIPFSGGSFKELDDLLSYALDANPKVKTVIRSVDITLISNPWDFMRSDLGAFPTYLYDDNPWNDVRYLLNRDVAFGRAIPMALDRHTQRFQPGITSFDDYSSTGEEATGLNTVCPNGYFFSERCDVTHLSEEEKQVIRENVEHNITRIADEHPDIEFYCFFSPFSIDAWNDWNNRGILFQSLETKAYAAELILPHKNIHLFTFDSRTDITTDLNNYSDSFHYAAWVNSLILKWMHDGYGQLTEGNYKEVLQKEAEFYTSDYRDVYEQADYEADLYAAALLNGELTGAEPRNIPLDDSVFATQPRSDGLAEWPLTLDLTQGHRYLSFFVSTSAVPDAVHVSAADASGRSLPEREFLISNSRTEPQHVVLDLSRLSGTVTVTLRWRFPDSNAASAEAPFSDFILY